jgi:hypothetical protein
LLLLGNGWSIYAFTFSFGSLCMFPQLWYLSVSPTKNWMMGLKVETT